MHSSILVKKFLNKRNNIKTLLAISKISNIGLKCLLKHRTLALMLSHFLSSNFMTVIFRYLILSVSLLHFYKSFYTRVNALVFRIENRKMKITFMKFSVMLSPFTIESLCGRQIARLGKTKNLLCSLTTRIISLNPYVDWCSIINFLEFALEFLVKLMRFLFKLFSSSFFVVFLKIIYFLFYLKLKNYSPDASVIKMYSIKV